MIQLLDNSKILKELVEFHNSAISFGDEKSYDVEVIELNVDKLTISDCPTVFVDIESEYGLYFGATDRISYNEAKLCRPNSIFLTTFLSDNFSDMCFYPHDWIKVSYLYRDNINIGKKQNFKSKPGLSLLGGWTPSRTEIFKKLKEQNDSIAIAYYPRQSGDWDNTHSDGAYVDPLVSQLDSPEFRKKCINNNRLFTQNDIQNKRGIVYSYLIPNKLYTCSDIHFVAETEDDIKLKEDGISYGFYVTEKTVKSVLSKRPFTLFGCERFLEKMEMLGFETFGDIIDESYDLEPNTHLRHTLSVESFVDFVKQDKKTRTLALKKIESRLIRNKKHMQDLYHWTLPALKMIKEIA